MPLPQPNRRGDAPQILVDINTTPLIDVMLVLLIMLIITIPIQLHSVNLNLPVPSTAEPPPPPQVVQLDISEEGRYAWNGEPLADLSELDARLKLASTEAVAPEVHIRAHRQAHYKFIAAALASAQREGLSKLGIVSRAG